MYMRIARLALRRPLLIPALLRVAWTFRARDWYRRLPFLPVPPRSYMRWRMETAYGEPDFTPHPEQVERYVLWVSRMRRLMRADADD